MSNPQASGTTTQTPGTRKTFLDPVLGTAAQDRGAYLRLHAHLSRVWIEMPYLKTLTKWNSEMEGVTDEEIGGVPGRLRFLVMTAAMAPAIIQFAEEYTEGQYPEEAARFVLHVFWREAPRADLTESQERLYRQICTRIYRIDRMVRRRCAGHCPHCGHKTNRRESLRCQVCNRFREMEASA